MSIDQTTHSLFRASKVAADVMVQEYGRYFGMKTGTFRGGCLTGPGIPARSYGFGLPDEVRGDGARMPDFRLQGKQVRDSIHSADLVASFEHFYGAPRPGEVYNMGEPLAIAR